MSALPCPNDCRYPNCHFCDGAGNATPEQSLHWENLFNGFNPGYYFDHVTTWKKWLCRVETLRKCYPHAREFEISTMLERCT